MNLRESLTAAVGDRDTHVLKSYSIITLHVLVNIQYSHYFPHTTILEHSDSSTSVQPVDSSVGSGKGLRSDTKNWVRCFSWADR